MDDAAIRPGRDAMRRRHRYRTALLAGIGLLGSSLLHAADMGRSGFATSDNFTVLTPRQETSEAANRYANRLARTAESLRREIAREWLGGELPPRQGRTLVTVSFEADRDAGLTWAMDDPRREFHTLYLTTSPDLAIGSTLAHEMVHVVLATSFPHPHRLATWLEEGIACQYDDEARKRSRERELATIVRTGRYPSIAPVLQAHNLRASDKRGYTVAASVTQLLLSLDPDKTKLVEFGQYGSRHGWDRALNRYYEINGVDQLQEIWQQSLPRFP